MDQVTYAQVLLPLPLQQTFTYRIPDQAAASVTTGSRVLVPFGQRKILAGLVWSLHHDQPDLEVKDILGMLDNQPVINPRQAEMWQWMADYYLCSLGEVMKAAMPAGLKLESKTRLFTVQEFESEKPFTETEELAWLFLRKNEGCSIQDLGAVLKRKNPLPLIHQLQKKGAIALEEKVSGSFKPRMETRYRLKIPVENESQLHQLLDELNRAPRQKEILEMMLGAKPATETNEPILSRKRIQTEGGSTAAAEQLVTKGILIREVTKISRLAREIRETHPPARLNGEQQKVLEAIQCSGKDTVHLIHGVTSSGKTEVYIHLIAQALKKPGQVLYLLPEIALTEQIINRLTAIFGDQIGVFHSRYSDREKIELWMDVLSKDNRYRIILGARSALFLPFSQLSLVIIDEEHESSYKQNDPAPRYQARDTAIVLAKIHRARTILGSATPSVESYDNCIRKKYQLHELKQRFGSVPMPEIILANLKEAYKRKQMKGHLTPQLLEGIDQALDNGEQVILFQNRRGYSPYVECDQCRHIPKCTACDVSLTLHKYRNRLVCHYCGNTEPVTQECPVCHAQALRTKGMGTERLEDEIGILFPKARISRLDLETTRSRKSYIRILEDFELGKTDILIGTQMITKGLDFSRVRVVGIVNADNLLHFPDFRSFERSFQLLTQVSGRAGRRKDRGLVIIQTYDPTHRIISQVLQHQYQLMFQTEIQDRKAFFYPPFSRLIKMTVKHKDPDLVNRCAYHMAKSLRTHWGSRILGPQAPPVSRIQHLHLRQILIKAARGNEHKMIRIHLKQLTEELQQDKSFRQVIIQADVDPY